MSGLKWLTHGLAFAGGAMFLCVIGTGLYCAIGAARRPEDGVDWVNAGLWGGMLGGAAVSLFAVPPAFVLGAVVGAVRARHAGRLEPKPTGPTELPPRGRLPLVTVALCLLAALATAVVAVIGEEWVLAMWEAAPYLGLAALGLAARHSRGAGVVVLVGSVLIAAPGLFLFVGYYEPVARLRGHPPQPQGGFPFAQIAFPVLQWFGVALVAGLAVPLELTRRRAIRDER